MYLNDIYIRSPILALGGDPNCFDLDWRHTAARVVAESREKIKLPPVLADDPEFAVEVEYIKAVSAAPENRLSEAQLFKRFRYHHTVARWVTDTRCHPLAQHLQPLLLSPCPLADVIRHSDYDEEIVRVYHNFYFDVRDAALERVRSELLRAIVAGGPTGELPESPTPAQRWTLAAAHPMGYTLLSAQWGLTVSQKAKMKPTEQAAHTQSLAQALLATRLLSGRISSEDALGVLTAGISREKLDHDMGKGAGENESWQLAMALLKLTAPQMASQTLTDSKRTAVNAALHARRQAETSIGGTKIADKGRAAGVSDLNERLRGRAKEAVKAAKEGVKK